jgi:hypothetical protein
MEFLAFDFGLAAAFPEKAGDKLGRGPFSEGNPDASDALSAAKQSIAAANLWFSLDFICCIRIPRSRT